MSKKKKKSSKKRRKQSKPKPDISFSSLPDRRLMERSLRDITELLEEQDFDSIKEANAFLQAMLASGQPLKPRKPRQPSPVEQAQELIYQAWDSSGKRRVKLALQALEVSRDCTDAYVLLAEEAATSLEEAKQLYEEGVKAGERTLGPQVFEEEVGYFWGITKTRPYMRARAGLAQCLWELDQHQEAIAHYTAMLRLNPGDNQGIRYLLTNCLLEVGDDQALGKLLDEYEDDGMANWLYSRALWMFRQEGTSDKANGCLKEALEQNPFVPDYLLGKKRLPRQIPSYIGFGDKNEAIAYAAEAVKVWQKSKGALEWLADQAARYGSKKTPSPQ